MGLFKSKADRLYEKAKDEFKFRNSGDTAFAEIERAAEMGSDHAMGFLMEFYTAPLSKYHNGAKGAKVCEYMVRKHSIPLAKFNLGRLYYFGDGVPRDFEKAYRLFEEAANARKYSAYQGNGYIGMMYFWGDGVPQSYEKAGKYLSDKTALTFSDHEWDVMYCYHYMQLRGLGGIPKNESDAWKALEEIYPRKDISPRTRSFCTELVCNRTVLRLKHLLEAKPQNYNAIQLCLRQLEAASKNGNLKASCTLAEFYLRYHVTHTEHVKDYETGEMEVLSETDRSLDEEARIYLRAVRDQMDGAIGEDRKLLLRLLDYSDKINAFQPDLCTKIYLGQ